MKNNKLYNTYSGETWCLINLLLIIRRTKRWFVKNKYKILIKANSYPTKQLFVFTLKATERSETSLLSLMNLRWGLVESRGERRTGMRYEPLLQNHWLLTTYYKQQPLLDCKQKAKNDFILWHKTTEISSSLALNINKSYFVECITRMMTDIHSPYPIGAHRPSKHCTKNWTTAPVCAVRQLNS